MDTPYLLRSAVTKQQIREDLSTVDSAVRHAMKVGRYGVLATQHTTLSTPSRSAKTSPTDKTMNRG